MFSDFFDQREYFFLLNGVRGDYSCLPTYYKLWCHTKLVGEPGLIKTCGFP